MVLRGNPQAFMEQPWLLPKTWVPGSARMHPFALSGSARMEVTDRHNPFPNLVDARAIAMHRGFGRDTIPLVQPPKWHSGQPSFRIGPYRLVASVSSCQIFPTPPAANCKHLRSPPPSPPTHRTRFLESGKMGKMGKMEENGGKWGIMNKSRTCRNNFQRGRKMGGNWRKKGENGGKREKNGTENRVFTVPFPLFLRGSEAPPPPPHRIPFTKMKSLHSPTEN